jgi:hypothetical protein
VSPRSGTCSDTRLLVSISLDCGLSELEHAMLHAHLSRCEPCAAYALEAAAFTQKLREAPLEPLPFPIVMPRRRGAGQRLIRVGATAAAAVAAIGVGLGSTFLFGAGSERSSVPVSAQLPHVGDAQLDDRVNWAGGLPRVKPSDLPQPLGQRQISPDG